MAYFYGASMVTDAFVTAFRIPNLLRDMFAEGALSSAFVPVFKERLVHDGTKKAFPLADVVLTALLLVVSLIVLLGIIAAPAIVYLIANGFVENPELFDLTVGLTRVMFVYLLLVSVSALLMGMLNSLGRFGIPAVAPAMFNIGIVVAVLALHSRLEQPAYALAIGVVIGGIGQAVIQVPSLLRIGYRFRPALSLLDEGLKRVVHLLLPMIVGMSAGRLNILASTLIASFLMEGSISFLSYSYRLMHFPLGVFAVALGTVVLPKASGLAAQDNPDQLNRTFREAVNLNLFVVLPASAVLALLGREIVNLIYAWGAFSQTDAANTALALRHYSYGLIGFSLVRVVVPFFYACNDSRLPMKISFATVALNLALYYPLVKMLDFAGLAAATSLAGIANAVMLLAFLPGKGITIHPGRLGLNSFRMVVAALLAVVVARLVPLPDTFASSALFQRVIELAVPLAGASVLYIFFCFILRVREMKRLFSVLRRQSGE